MQHFLVRYRILHDRGSGLTVGKELEVYWNDSTNAFVVYDFDDENDLSGTLRTSGPDLGLSSRTRSPGPDYAYIKGNDSITVDGIRMQKLQYQFCESTALQIFQGQPLFPYAKKVSLPGHFSCSLEVCDLSILDSYSVVNPSDFVTPDGSITVSATSSNGVVKFNMGSGFYYDYSGQVSGEFRNLLAGKYTIFAKDPKGCTDVITIELKVPDFHNPLYRVEYTDINKIVTRVDICERGYEGEPIQIKSGKDPFIIKGRGESEINKFKPFIPSQAVLAMISETNFYFRNLFTQDDRKYLLKYYKYLGQDFEGAFIEGADDLIDVETFSQIASSYKTWNEVPTVSFRRPGLTSKVIYWPYTFLRGQTYTISIQYSMTSVEGFNTVQVNYKTLSATLLERAINTAVYSTNGASDVLVFECEEDASYLALQAIMSNTNLITAFVTVVSIQIESEDIIEPDSRIDFDLKWSGYLISSNYSEAYVATPYEVQVVATDGLADLKNFDFVDEFGNRFKDDITPLRAICEILKKTDLKINILCGINRFEEDMATDEASDPLNQCTFDPTIFYTETESKNCYEVLQYILEPFGARLIQRKGKWLIYCIEEAVHAFAYREFDYTGVYVDNGTIYDAVDLAKPVLQQRAAYRDRDQVLEIVPSYGYFYFKHKLLLNASLVKSYSFEQDDIISHDGVASFRNWNVNIQNANGVVYGIKETKAFEGAFNFYYEILENNVPQFGVDVGKLKLISAGGQIEYNSPDAIEFRFNYAIILAQREDTNREIYIPPAWVKIQWMVKIGDYYLNDNAWTTNSNYKYNDLYVSTFNESQELKILVPLHKRSAVVVEDFEVEFILTTDRTLDFVSADGDPYTQLRAIPTTSLRVGKKVKGQKSYFGPRGGLAQVTTLYWVLANDEAAESGVAVIRPDDYDEDTNPRVWRLEDTLFRVPASSGYNPLLDTPTQEQAVSYVYIDNVVLLHYPKGNKPVADITIEKPNNPNIKVDFDHEYLLGDIDIVNLNNSERNYKNYFKKLDGTPTQLWTRTYRAGSGKILALLADDYTSQYKRQSNKITGSMIGDVEITMLSIINEKFDGGRKYMFMGFEHHDKENTILFDMVELKDVVTDSGSESISAAFSKDFSLDFNS